jgi:hypothetical protein
MFSMRYEPNFCMASSILWDSAVYFRSKVQLAGGLCLAEQLTISSNKSLLITASSLTLVWCMLWSL